MFLLLLMKNKKLLNKGSIDWLTDREKGLKMKGFDRLSFRINQSNEKEDINEYSQKNFEKMM